MRTGTGRGITLVVVSSLVVAFVPNLAKLAYDAGATPQAVIAARYPISLAILVMLIAMSGGTIRLARRTLGSSLVAGASALIVGFGFMGSVAFIDVSLAILIFYLHPVLIGIYGHLTGANRLAPHQIVAAFGAIAGLGLALAVDFDRLDPRGLGLATMGTVGVTVMILANARTVLELGSLRANLQMTFFAGILMVLVVPAIGNVALPETAAGWIGMIGAAAGITIGFVLFFAAVPVLGATRATVISILEPVFGIVVAMLLLGERLTGLQWVGMAMVVGGLFAIELHRNALLQMRERLLMRRPSR